MPSIRFLAAAAGALLFAVAVPASAASSDPLAETVAQGQQLFAKSTFGGAGRTCDSCHVNGGKGPGEAGGHPLPSLENAAAIYPRFSQKAGRVMTLAAQIRHCIQGGLGAQPPAYGSAELVALETYLASLAHGQSLDMGGAPK
ncbi:SoxAX cytochrome complex subunit A precursor [mine drainage metagenome]|uniref:SoxAX cytochrome complex subunit A n=1 Tax=mine drainage metagenome TaxID=410659 RepID=A0A1J5S8E0_9ZZZZ